MSRPEIFLLHASADKQRLKARAPRDESFLYRASARRMRLGLAVALVMAGVAAEAAQPEETEKVFDALVAYARAPERAVLHHAGVVRHAAFSPDGQRIVTASFDQTARIWDAHSGKPLAKLSGHWGSVWSAAFIEDGKRVIAVADDATVRGWNVSITAPGQAPQQ